MRAAASSSARGRPSRRSQMLTTSRTFSGVNSNPARTACARSTKSCTAGDSRADVIRRWRRGISGIGNGLIRISVSIGNPRGSRLVTNAAVEGAAASRLPMTGAALGTCSRLSRMSRSRRERKSLGSASVSGTSGGSRSGMTEAIASSTRFGSVTDASGTHQTPSGKLSSSSAPACSERRVLPTPPGPSRVIKRSPERRASCTRARSASRPTRRVG